LPCAQERDLHLRIAAHGIQFSRLREVLYTVRNVPNSVSASYVHVLDQHRMIAERLIVTMQKTATATDARMQATAAFLARDARAYLQRGEVQKAREYFRVAASIHRTAGLVDAYRPWARCLLKVLGPELTEKLVMLRRAVA
jgi:hypothetical protein